MRVTCRPPTTLTSLLLLLLKKLPLELVNQVDPLQHLLLLLYVGDAGALHTHARPPPPDAVPARPPARPDPSAASPSEDRGQLGAPPCHGWQEADWRKAYDQHEAAWLESGLRKVLWY